MDDATWEKYSHYHSKSRLSLYGYCPLKYRKQYIDKVVTESTNYSLAVGTRIHDTFYNFFEVARDYPISQWNDFIHPDLTDYEKSMVEWFIEAEQERLELCGNDFDIWMPIVREEKFINDEYQIRGIIDRIDQINDDNFLIVEYKTSKSIYKPSLQNEFGFYSLLLQGDERFKDKTFLGCVVNPRLRKVEFMSPSRHSTIIKKLEKLNTSIETMDFNPLCTEAKYALCNGLCSIDEANLYKNID